LFGQGSKAQVLGPPALKKRVKDELRAMVNAAEKV
jgi:predicted DNA-binding transcriptional regulator YafY